MKHYKLQRNGGFTLVEIAIVLVIIGLLLGGILKGQEMMTNAKIKRTVNDFNGITAAVYSYVDRYGKLPGDDDAANARWAGVCGNGGNADGELNDPWSSTTDTHESREFWGHLRASGLIAGAMSDCQQPTHAFGGQIGAQNGAYGMSGATICMGNVDGKIADILDRQLDDAVRHTGSLRGSTTAGAWVVNTSYTVCKTL